jgi:hypothetical protein
MPGADARRWNQGKRIQSQSNAYARLRVIGKSLGLELDLDGPKIANVQLGSCENLNCNR